MAQGLGRDVNYELFASELPFPQAKGELQLTLGPRYGSWRRDRHAESELSAEFGLTNRWQLDIEAMARATGARARNADIRLEAFAFGLQRSWMGSTRFPWHAALGATLEFGSAAIDDTDSAVSDDREESARSQRIEFALSGVRDIARLHGLKLAASMTYAVPATLASGGERELASHIAFLLPFRHVALSTELSWSPELLPQVTGHRAIVTPGMLLSLPWSIQLGVATSQPLASKLRGRDISMKLIYEF